MGLRWDGGPHVCMRNAMQNRMLRNRKLSQIERRPTNPHLRSSVRELELETAYYAHLCQSSPIQKDTRKLSVNLTLRTLMLSYIGTLLCVRSFSTRITYGRGCAGKQKCGNASERAATAFQKNKKRRLRFISYPHCFLPRLFSLSSIAATTRSFSRFSKIMECLALFLDS